MQELTVNLPGRSYQITIGTNHWSPSLTKILQERNARRVVVVTNDALQRLYPDLLATELQQNGFETATCVIPDGEQHKTLADLTRIYNFLLERSSLGDSNGVARKKVSGVFDVATQNDAAVASSIL